MYNRDYSSKPRRIAPASIEVYKKGECFICGNPCPTYAHYECCVAYYRHQTLKQEEENKRAEDEV